MGIYYKELDIVRNKFYQYMSFFNGFSIVDEAKIKEIDKLVEEYRNKYIKTDFSYIPLYDNSQIYARLLAYLTKRKDLSWDDKLLFIIRFYDPELKVLQLYLDINHIDSKALEDEGIYYFSDDCFEKKIKHNSELETKCRSLISIYDPYIIKYEIILFKVLHLGKLEFNIKKSYIKSFFESYVTAQNSLEVTDKELMDILIAARAYKRKHGIPSINDLAFQLMHQEKIIGINSAKTAMIFMIYILDEEFKAFHFYDEYGNWKTIKEMCSSKLGFYNQDFVMNEVKFARDNHDSLTTLSLFPDARINQ